MQVTDAMVEAAMAVPPINNRGPHVFDAKRMRAALTVALAHREAEAVSNALPDDDNDLAQMVEDFHRGSVSFANEPDEFDHLIEFTPKRLREFILTITPPAVPSGMALVPVEPTPEMLGAWYRYKNGHRWPGEPPARDTSDYGAYRAMLTAAQEGR